MSDSSEASTVHINTPEVAGVAQGMAQVLRQVGTRHGRGAALGEAAGCIMGASIVLTDLCGAAAARDALAWHGQRAGVPLGPEVHAPFPLADEGLVLPSPRPIGASSHHVARYLRGIAREQGTRAAIETTCGVLRAGIAVVREMTDADVVALLLDRYAGIAANIATMSADELDAILPEQVH